MTRPPVVDLSLCICCGVCTECCPAVFVLNPAGYIEVADLPDYLDPDIEEAVRDCPVDCIAFDECMP
ncbi:MAG: ferredoxin [Deltaproteobacteria bacterium]|nr:ferredoxin [Deltaproteobacteria bacterium]